MAKITIEERSHDKINDKNDKTIGTIKQEKELPYSELTGAIFSCFFDEYVDIEDFLTFGFFSVIFIVIIVISLYR